MEQELLFGLKDTFALEQLIRADIYRNWEVYKTYQQEGTLQSAAKKLRITASAVRAKLQYCKRRRITTEQHITEFDEFKTLFLHAEICNILRSEEVPEELGLTGFKARLDKRLFHYAGVNYEIHPYDRDSNGEPRILKAAGDMMLIRYAGALGQTIRAANQDEIEIISNKFENTAKPIPTRIEAAIKFLENHGYKVVKSQD